MGVNLGFGSLRILKGQFRLLGGRTLGLANVRYCLLCGRTVGDHWTYALQIVQRTYAKSTGRTLLLEYPLVIPGRTKQPLDRCVIVLDVRPFGRTSATLPGELLAHLS